MDIVFFIIITLFVSLSINIVLKKINLPTIIGYIITGLIIAHLLNLKDFDNDTLLQIAEFGIVFLMFTIGLEFSVNKLKLLKYQVFVLGNLQIFLTICVVFIISYFVFALDFRTSVIIALIASLSSTAIVLKILNTNKSLNKRYGKLSISILLMQDLFVIPTFLIINFFTTSQQNFGEEIFNIIISGFILLILLWFIAKYLLEPFFNQVIKTTDDELFVGTILFLAIGSSYLAHVLGFSYSLGAFVAGMLIAETKYKYQAEAELVPFRDLLLGVFFVTVGMQIDLAIIVNNLVIILLLLIAVLIIKFVIVYAVVRINFSNRDAVRTALTLVQVGEFSLAILTFSRISNLLSEHIAQVILAVIIISMIISPAIIKHISYITDFLLRTKHQDNTTVNSYDLSGHIVLVGFGTFGKTIAKYLTENKIDYVAVDNNIDVYHQSKAQGENIIFGNIANNNLIETTKLSESNFVIVAIDNPDKLYNICYNLIRHIDIDRIIVKIHSRVEFDIIYELKLKHIIIENDLTSTKILDLLQNNNK